ncbi:MAG TPA: RelA/SpoT domain-containing protein [Blastocatellia bacterium]|nr:RelA/SpoT domain-containing protein [Blastocatellia bacterium]
MDQKTLLKNFNLPEDALDKTGLSWEDLNKIHLDHSSNTPNLLPTANYIAERLRQVNEVHSLKVRIKDPEHLVAKIIRKKLDDPSLTITPDNYRDSITDLIGIRAMHLFKEDWRPIHTFIKGTWKLKEKPIANVRKGDPEELTQQFKAEGCKIKEHPRGYRSIHYLVKSQPSVDQFVAEIQVRTIFEEGWAEIDHKFSYPHDLNNVILAQFSVIFNRLAGSADEMGSYIRFLKGQLGIKEREYNEAIAKHDKLAADLKAEVEKLEITKQQKEELEKRVKSLTDAATPKPLFDFGKYDFSKIDYATLFDNIHIPVIQFRESPVIESPVLISRMPEPSSLKVPQLGNLLHTKKESGQSAPKRKIRKKVVARTPKKKSDE